MKSQSILGIVLVIVGVLILIYQGFSFTHKESVAKVGPVEINANKTESVPISPIIGGVCLVAGVAVFVMGARKS